jgi:hypothetical protein
MRDDLAVDLSSYEQDSDNDPHENKRHRRSNPLAELIRENHELYNEFMKKKMPRLLRDFGYDLSEVY